MLLLAKQMISSLYITLFSAAWVMLCFCDIYCLLFINDLPPDAVVSDLFLYADDAKIFRPIKNTQDVRILQGDLHEMSIWSDEWNGCCNNC